MGCPPADLGCLCSLPQELVSEYVALVQPCVDGAEGAKACTEGARSRKFSPFRSWGILLISAQSIRICWRRFVRGMSLARWLSGGRRMRLRGRWMDHDDGVLWLLLEGRVEGDVLCSGRGDSDSG